jgi:hypothetical protein
MESLPALMPVCSCREAPSLHQTNVGYDLRDDVEGTLSSFWRESKGSDPADAADARGDRADCPYGERRQGRKRQVYASTDLGRERLRAWITEEPSMQSPRNQIFLKVWMMRHGLEGRGARSYSPASAAGRGPVGGCGGAAKA